MFTAQIDYTDKYLLPFLSEETIKFHYGKHHTGYANTLNSLIQNTEFQNLSLEEIINKSRQTDTKIFNNAAQLFNHNFYWKCLKPSPKMPSENFMDMIRNQFGNFDKFREEYIKFAATLFGSGWSWLVKKDNKLSFINTSNAETPIGTEIRPLCVVDLWEHAYYIDYRNNRADYLSQIIINCINWQFCESMLEK